MNEPISLAILREAVRLAAANETVQGFSYQQNTWGDCGTACCVAGFARLLAGQQPTFGLPEHEDHPAAHRLCRLMLCLSEDVLRVMQAVDDEGRIQLAEADLSGVNLRGADLSGADLRGTNLGRAVLSGANLRGANLSGANLSEANLRVANLSGADLSGANLKEAYFGGAVLDGTKWPE